MLRIRHFLRYPPLWMAGLVGVYFWSLLTFGTPIENDAATKAAAALFRFSAPYIVLGLMLTAIGLRAWQLKEKLPTVSSNLGVHRIFGGTFYFDWIRRWTQNDVAIACESDDQFGHVKVAERVARRLIELNEPAALAIVGPKGSGKSTIKNLVRGRLAANKRILFTEVSLWPFETASAAARGILNALVKTLSREVDTLSILDVEGNYIEAIKAAGGRFAVLAALTKHSRQPSELLDQVTVILEAIDFKAVIWIEDLERFSGGDIERRTGYRQAEKIAPIRALIHLLDQSPRITVVLADETLGAGFDLGKIARFIERPPTIQLSDVGRIISSVRSGLLNGWPRPFIEAAAGRARDRLGALASTAGSQWLFELGDEETHPEIALCSLVSNPRVLKSALRNVMDSWFVLAGEIDLDDAFLMAAIREARPDVFALIDKLHQDIATGFEDPLATRKGANSPGWKRFKAVVDDRREESPALWCILHYVFGELPENRRISTPTRHDRPQGLSNPKYWRRWTVGATIPEVDSDQGLLKNIRDWRERKGEKFVSLVREEGVAGRAVQFANQIPRKELGRLFEAVCALDANEDGALWLADFGQAPGVSAVRYIAKEMYVADDDAFAEACIAVIKRYTPLHIPLARSVMLSVADDRDGQALLPSNARQRLRAAIDDVLVATYGWSVTAPDRLLASQKGGSPFYFYHLCIGPERLSAAFNEEPFPNWRSVATTIVSLVKTLPSVGVPLLLPFIATSNRSAKVRSGDFDAESTGLFLAERAGKLFDLDELRIALPRTFESTDDELQEMWVATHRELGNP